MLITYLPCHACRFPAWATVIFQISLCLASSAALHEKSGNAVWASRFTETDWDGYRYKNVLKRQMALKLLKKPYLELQLNAVIDYSYFSWEIFLRNSDTQVALSFLFRSLKQISTKCFLMPRGINNLLPWTSAQWNEPNHFIFHFLSWKIHYLLMYSAYIHCSKVWNIFYCIVEHRGFWQTPVLHFQSFAEIWHWAQVLQPGEYLSWECNMGRHF